MTGEEFLYKVRGIKQVQSIEWDVQGDPFNPDKVKIKVVADDEEFSIFFGSPVLHHTADSLLSTIWCERVAVCLLVNKTMELLGRPERFNSECSLRNISDAIDFAAKCVREHNKNLTKPHIEK